MAKKKPVRELEEPELAETAEEGVFHGPEQVDGEWFCRWDEEQWPCEWVRETEAQRVKDVKEQEAKNEAKS